MFATTKALAFQRSAEFARRIKKHVFWRRRSSRYKQNKLYRTLIICYKLSVYFTLSLLLQSFKVVLSIPFFCRAKEAKAPAHGTHQAALPLFRSCLCGNILQSVASLVARVFSSVFRVLRNSFSYPHFVRITHTQTVLALNPKNRRPLGCDAYGAGWVLSYQCYGWNSINTANRDTRLYPFKLLSDTKKISIPSFASIWSYRDSLL